MHMNKVEVSASKLQLIKAVLDNPQDFYFLNETEKSLLLDLGYTPVNFPIYYDEGHIEMSYSEILRYDLIRVMIENMHTYGQTQVFLQDIASIETILAMRNFSHEYYGRYTHG